MDLELLALELLLSPFVRIFGVLCVALYGFGFRSSGFGFLALLLSLGLASTVAGKQFLTSSNQVYSDVQRSEAVDALLVQVKERVGELEREEAEALFDTAEEGSSYTAEQVLLFSYCLNELKVLFQFAVAFLLPLVAIELFAAVLMSLLRIEGVSIAFITLPFKVVIFISIGGTELLLGGFLPGGLL